MSGSRSCKERKGRSCCLGMSRVAKYSRLHSAPPLSSPSTPGPGCLWSQQAPPPQPAACLPPSLSPPGQPPPFPSPPPGPRAEPQQGQRVSGAGQAGLLLSGEPGGVGSGQAVARPGARAEPSGQAQAGVCVAESPGELGCSPVGDLGWGNQEEGPGGCGRFMSVFGSRREASSVKLGPWPVAGEGVRALETPLPQRHTGAPSSSPAAFLCGGLKLCSPIS